MIDLRELKAQHDLRHFVEADLGPAHGRGGQAMLWKCPFHNEQKGYSLAVWHDGWRCFGACGRGGDILDWLQRYRGLSFTDACAVLGANGNTLRPLPRCKRRYEVPQAQPPDDDWQRQARYVVTLAMEQLWSPDGEPALDYLHRRGLTSETIQNARLGLIPGMYWEWRTIRKLNVPCGITIPWFIDGDLWAVKVRRAAGVPKYAQIAGGSSGGLYNMDNLIGHDAILLVEGEFDALLAEQEGSGLVGVGTLGSAASPLNRLWWSLVAECRVVLLSYDSDEAGIKGAAHISAITRRARTIGLPFGKDITDFVLQGGSVREWLAKNL
jgi:DNA primase